MFCWTSFVVEIWAWVGDEVVKNVRYDARKSCVVNEKIGDGDGAERRNQIVNNGVRTRRIDDWERKEANHWHWFPFAVHTYKKNERAHVYVCARARHLALIHWINIHIIAHIQCKIVLLLSMYRF